MTEQAQGEQTKPAHTPEAQMVKAALEDVAHDIRGIHLMIQVWFTLFVIGAIIWVIALANS